LIARPAHNVTAVVERLSPGGREGYGSSAGLTVLLAVANSSRSGNPAGAVGIVGRQGKAAGGVPHLAGGFAVSELRLFVLAVTSQKIDLQLDVCASDTARPTSSKRRMISRCLVAVIAMQLIE